MFVGKVEQALSQSPEPDALNSNRLLDSEFVPETGLCITALGGLLSTITISVAILVELMCSIRPSLTLRLTTCEPLERWPCHVLSLERMPSSELSHR